MSAPPIIRPDDLEQLRTQVAEAARSGTHLELRAGGSLREVGAPQRQRTIVDLSRFCGIVEYAPGELVVSVLPATPLAELEALLSEQDQMLAFEPWDPGPIFGQPCGEATIGGIVAAGIAGPRRVSAGAVRDHLLGFSALSGHAETFKAGSVVVKNVTGFDVPKIMAGSWGQLAVLTELTLKVVPRPAARVTLALHGLTPGAAIEAMARAMGSPCAVAAAAHAPPPGAAAHLTALRLEGIAESVDARVQHLHTLLADFGEVSHMSEDAAQTFWSAVREARPLRGAETLWRLHVAPSRAAELAEALQRGGVSWLLDWAGALLWAGAPAALDVRTAAQARGGHAMLLRAPPELRRTTPIRQPQPQGIAALSARLKRAFDPAGVLDPDRFG